MTLNPFEQLIRKIAPDAKLLRAWELTGGVSAQVTAIEVEFPDGQVKKWIVRQHGEYDRKNNPNIAADEFRLMGILKAANVIAPAPIYLDTSLDLFTVPVVVVEFIDGQTEFAPSDLTGFVGQVATNLHQIHRVLPHPLAPSPHVERGNKISSLDFLPTQEDFYTTKLYNAPVVLDDMLSEGRVRDVLEAVWPIPQRNPSVLLHGDYWPGNWLWRDGQLVGIVDWEDAAIGDPLADVANTRLELLWALGVEAMKGFTGQYRVVSDIDYANLPYWDLCAALRPASKLGTWGLDKPVEIRMYKQHKQFVNQALEAIERR